MTDPSVIDTSVVDGVGRTFDPAGLAGFLDPGCAAAIWQRQTPRAVRAWLDGLEADTLPRGRVILQPDAVADTVGHLFDIYNVPTGSHRDRLLADIVGLAGRFSDLMGARFLRLRLDVIDTNACRRFHVDAIKARLVCTYRGTGTQYGLAAEGQEPRQIHTVETGSPILLRGKLWAPELSPGLLHRSPPIEGTGETRLILVLDPVADPDSAPDMDSGRVH